jgi:hypothetical protein
MHEVLLANTKLYERKLELINEEIYDFIENYTIYSIPLKATRHRINGKLQVRIMMKNVSNCNPLNAGAKYSTYKTKRLSP